jgi:hypothetical protein
MWRSMASSSSRSSSPSLQALSMAPITVSKVFVLPTIARHKSHARRSLRSASAAATCVIVNEDKVTAWDNPTSTAISCVPV